MIDSQVLLVAALLAGLFFGGDKAYHATRDHVVRPVAHTISRVFHHKKPKEPHVRFPEQHRP